ncbi:MAG: methyltransferase domain-containing protein [Chloroflexi bacterium]|nr:methyltransferase domain-containing protein [Chloroflexota bacterium]
MYQILEHPLIYRLAQFVFAPGGEHFFETHIAKIVTELAPIESALDVGCGPRSYLWPAHVTPVGCDISLSYMKQFCLSAGLGIVGSIGDLPFSNEKFSTTWCIGVLHHLPDKLAQSAIQEMYRVTKMGGHVVIVDSVLPKLGWHRPIAWGIRKSDRGRFVRTESCLREIIKQVPAHWQISRQSYSFYGLEALTCIATKG